MSDLGNVVGRAMKIAGVVLVVLLFVGMISCSYYLEHLRFCQ